MLQVLDLFSGIGGFSLGLERTGGFQTVAFCEIDPYCRRVLAKHWPDVPCYDDVRALSAERLAADGIAVDVICGGFPCQDISTAGKGAGLAGERSGLWSEIARLVGELRPRYVLVENVSALLGRGMGRVLGDLAALGFDSEWHCIPASAVGAPHRRDRIWIVAYPNGAHVEGGGVSGRIHQKNPVPECASTSRDARADVAYPAQLLCDGSDHHAGVGMGGQSFSQPRDGGGAADVADAKRVGSKVGHDQRRESPRKEKANNALPRGEDVSDAIKQRLERLIAAGAEARATYGPGDGGDPCWWSLEPDVGRVAHGVPSRVDRLRSLGNAVVPAIPELIGHAIIKAERVT